MSFPSQSLKIHQEKKSRITFVGYLLQSVFSFFAVVANIIFLEERYIYIKAIEWEEIGFEEWKEWMLKGWWLLRYILNRSMGYNHSMKMYVFHIHSMISLKANGLAGFQNFSVIRTLIRRDPEVYLLHNEFTMILYQFSSMGQRVPKGLPPSIWSFPSEAREGTPSEVRWVVPLDGPSWWWPLECPVFGIALWPGADSVGFSAPNEGFFPPDLKKID